MQLTQGRCDTRIVKSWFLDCKRIICVLEMPANSELQWSKRLDINIWTDVTVASIENDLTDVWSKLAQLQRQTSETRADIVNCGYCGRPC